MAGEQVASGPAAVDVVRSVYEAFGRGDVEALVALLDPGVEIRQSAEVPWGGTYRGIDEALRFFGTLVAHIRTQVEVDRLIVAGDTVVENGRTCGYVVRSGHEFAVDETHVWTVRDGRITGMHAYVDNAAMLAALAA
ncbi:MAG TPA: nuclear transport factor 2 family protein [Solirubrobacteraceae bacterium]|nr:nuclear transport factor 2 family protein [Solirubrobacteraceae bacterium]